MSRVSAHGDRYELTIDGERAGLITLREDGDVVDLLHTEVDAERRGSGLGSELVAGALDDIRSRGKRVRPSCAFVAAYLRRHPEYGDLLEQ